MRPTRHIQILPEALKPKLEGIALHFPPLPEIGDPIKVTVLDTDKEYRGVITKRSVSGNGGIFEIEVKL